MGYIWSPCFDEACGEKAREEKEEEEWEEGVRQERRRGENRSGHVTDGVGLLVACVGPLATSAQEAGCLKGCYMYRVKLLYLLCLGLGQSTGKIGLTQVAN